MGYEVVRDAIVNRMQTEHGFIVPASADNWNFIDVISKELSEAASTEEHALVGSRHTVSSLVPGNVLRALTADTFGFASLDDLYYTQAVIDSMLGGQNELSELDDVNLVTPIDNNLLAYDNGSSKWTNQTAAEAGLAAAAHTHPVTELTGPVRGSIIRGVDGPAWEVYALGTTGQVLLSDGSDLGWTHTFTAQMVFTGAAPGIDIQNASGGFLRLTNTGGVSTGNVIGEIDFYGVDDAPGVGASIHAEAQANWDAAGRRTELVFKTTTALSLSEHMRITRLGLVAIHGGTQPTWDHSPTGLAVEGSSEFDGTASFDGAIRKYGTAGAQYVYLEWLEGGSRAAWINADYSNDQWVFLVGEEVGRQMVLVDKAGFSGDFGHAGTVNPTFYVQGPSIPTVNSTRWWSIEFDETTDNERAIYNVGSGRHEFQYQGNRILTVARYNNVETRLEFDLDDVFGVGTLLDMRLHPITNVNWIALGTIYSVTQNDPIRIPGGIEIDEITEPAAPQADRLRFFAKDDGGKTALYVRFPTGVSQLVLVEA